MLKLKALLYRYTGIYLAHKEENKFIRDNLKSIDFKNYDNFKTELDIALWQVHNGFTTMYCFFSVSLFKLRRSRFKFLYPIINMVEIFIRQVMYDLELIVTKVRKK